MRRSGPAGPGYGHLIEAAPGVPGAAFFAGGEGCVGGATGVVCFRSQVLFRFTGEKGAGRMEVGCGVDAGRCGAIPCSCAVLRHQANPCGLVPIMCADMIQ